MKTIISFDLDMTLLSHSSGKVPDSAVEAINLLRDNYYIVLATGRDMDSHYSRQYKQMVNPDAVIHLNGTKITVGDELIFEHLMPDELLNRLIAFAQEHGYSVGATFGDEDYYTNSQYVARCDEERWGVCGRQFKDPWDLLNMGVKTLAYLGKERGVRNIEEHFPEVRLPMFSNGEGADIIMDGTSKAVGLKQLCGHLGCSLENTYVFGDSMNDYEIIQEAGIGIAMGNAIDEIKQVADYITTDIDKDGVWNACRHFKLI